jgi:MFS family permease
MAMAGYALSAVCRIALLPAGGNVAVLAAIAAADRVGKGIRTPPRDALLSLSARPEALATAFGVHRSLDAAGALLGPLLAFALLASRPGAFSQLFVIAFLLALAGLGALLLLVREVRPALPPSPAPAPAFALDPALRGLLAASALLGLATVSDGFLYLVLQRSSGIPVSSFPLLFVATSLVHFALAVPLGRLADRVGRSRVFLAGHASLLLAYGSAALAGPGWLAPASGVLLLGAHHAATEGVVMALAASLVAPARRAGSLALVGAVTGLARLGASLLFGLVWSRFGTGTALLLFGALLLVTLAAAAATLRASEGAA